MNNPFRYWPAWRVVVDVRLAELEQQVKTAKHLPAEQKEYVDARLTTARNAVGQRSGTSLKLADGFSGFDVETAWTNIHAAEVCLARYPEPDAKASTLTDALARATASLKADDPRLAALKDAVKKAPTDDAIVLAADTLRAALDVSDDDHRRLRSFRNVLIGTAALIFFVAFVLALVGCFAAKSIDVCWISGNATYCPTEGAGATGGDVVTTEFFGVLGAVLVGVVAVRRLRGTSTPYSVGLASLALKVPAGAVSAVVGIVLVHLLKGFAIGSALELKAYAVVFGAAQQTVTTLVDRQAQNVLNSIPTTSKDAAADSN